MHKDEISGLPEVIEGSQRHIDQLVRQSLFGATIERVAQWYANLRESRVLGEQERISPDNSDRRSSGLRRAFGHEIAVVLTEVFRTDRSECDRAAGQAPHTPVPCDTRSNPGRVVKAAILILLAVFPIGCHGGSVDTTVGATYDGWRIGALETCPPYPAEPTAPGTELTTSECEDNLAHWLAVGRDGFDRRDPNHEPIVRATLHDLDTKTFHSARCCGIAVFELADGSIRAIGINLVVFPFGNPSYANNVIDYGPDK